MNILRTTVLSIAALIAIMTAAPARAQHEHGAPAPERLGTVHFSTSCAPAAQHAFDRAVALLHSFGYSNAASAFTAIAEKDPTCAMAYWGLAMTHYHPLWEAPGSADLQQGAQAIDKAQAICAKTQRERDYIAALHTFYQDWQQTNHHTRALAYESAMEKLQARYPEDREARIFYALAVRGNAPTDDKAYTNQKKAGAILEKTFAEEPEHPGLAHYIIHCYDYPSLSDRALPAARRYAKIAPDAPHALHMPSHIFTRLGFWDDSIQSNLASAAAARHQNLVGDELHARDYLVYAYLQKGQDRAAKKALTDIPPSAPNPADPSNFAGLYALGTMPARYALERHNWREAASLDAPQSSGRYAWTVANAHLARALGSARTGHPDQAQQEIRKLDALQKELKEADETYWATQAQIQAEIAAAWLSFAQGSRDEALKQMRAAADHEDATDKHPVTPGVVLPARELLGEMLLETNHPQEALTMFDAVLRSAPNRFNSLAGAARAADLAGQKEIARKYSTQLLHLASEADGDRPALAAAKTLLAAN